MLTKYDGTECTKEKRALTLRLMDVFKRPTDNAASLSAEIKLLTDADKEDFKRWFNEAGYPVI